MIIINMNYWVYFLYTSLICSIFYKLKRKKEGGGREEKQEHTGREERKEIPEIERPRPLLKILLQKCV